jgi:hypothetical protein
MKPMTKAGVLALIALMQVAVIGGVLAAYRQLSATLSRWQWEYKQLYEATHDLVIDFGIIPNPFLPWLGLLLLSFCGTLGLLIDQIQHRGQPTAQVGGQTPPRKPSLPS